jgi:hypothetical protein
MPKPIWLISLGLCCVLGVAAIVYQSRDQAPMESPPPQEDIPLELEVDRPVPDASPPATEPQATPSPTAPQPATGTAINPPQTAQLIASQPESRINLRSQPTTSATARGYGIVGDSVQLLRSAQGSDGTWYYVKFEQSRAEGWIRGDFINVGGQAASVPTSIRSEGRCEGLLEAMTFTAYYSDNSFTQVRFVNLETQNTFDSTLRRQGSNTQGQPLYQGTASPPTGGTYRVELTDLSGGNPGDGSQVAIDYHGIVAGTGTCP